MFFQVFAVDREFGKVVLLDEMQRVSQRHFTVGMMVAVRFPVGCDMNQLVPLARIVEGASEALRQGFAAR